MGGAVLRGNLGDLFCAGLMKGFVCFLKGRCAEEQNLVEK